jgi:hypothetical protein
MGCQKLEDHSEVGINSDLLQATVEEICESLLGMPLDVTRNLQQGLSILTCCISLVSVKDQHHYLLFINCDNQLLDAIAEGIFDMNTEDIDIDDMLSALQELTNMIGGQLSNVVEREFQLGLPFTMDITGEMPDIAPEDIITQVTLHQQNRYINVVLSKF